MKIGRCCRHYLPDNWQKLAGDTGALKGLRKDKSAERLLRTLLIHLGCGHSLRETVVRAKQANLADLSDVALLKRLKKSKDWLYVMCVKLFLAWIFTLLIGLRKCP
jgi:hypothetical protein